MWYQYGTLLGTTVRLDDIADRLSNRFPFLRRVLTPPMMRFVRFGIVGVAGIVVNLAVYYLALVLLFPTLEQPTTIPLLGRSLPLKFPLSSLCGIVVSIFGNFILNNAWTWADRSAQSGPFWLRLGKYYFAASFGAVVNHSVFVFLSGLLGTRLAIVWQLIGILCGMVLNFVINHFWTFRLRSNVPGAADQRDGALANGAPAPKLGPTHSR